MIITINPLITMLIMAALTYFEVTWISPEKVGWSGYLGAVFVILGVIMVVSRPQKKSLARQA